MGCTPTMACSSKVPKLVLVVEPQVPDWSPLAINSSFSDGEKVEAMIIPYWLSFTGIHETPWLSFICTQIVFSLLLIAVQAVFSLLFILYHPVNT